MAINEITFTESRRHVVFNIDVVKFDNSDAIAEYARQFCEDGYLHESLDDRADQVAADLKDNSAAMRFKAKVRELRRNRCSHIA